MNPDEQQRIKQLLKESLHPIGSEGGGELEGDLWPRMLARLQQRTVPVPWFDWALLAAVAAFLVIFPGAIPVLLYHL